METSEKSRAEFAKGTKGKRKISRRDAETQRGKLEWERRKGDGEACRKIQFFGMICKIHGISGMGGPRSVAAVKNGTGWGACGRVRRSGGPPCCGTLWCGRGGGAFPGMLQPPVFPKRRWVWQLGRTSFQLVLFRETERPRWSFYQLGGTG